MNTSFFFLKKRSINVKYNHLKAGDCKDIRLRKETFWIPESLKPPSQAFLGFYSKRHRHTHLTHIVVPTLPDIPNQWRLWPSETMSLSWHLIILQHLNQPVLFAWHMKSNWKIILKW